MFFNPQTACHGKHQGTEVDDKQKEKKLAVKFYAMPGFSFEKKRDKHQPACTDDDHQAYCQKDSVFDPDDSQLLKKIFLPFRITWINFQIPLQLVEL